MNKNITFSIFILIAIVQLYAPASMIFVREEVLAKGTEYKFRTTPIDPNDPFRGKYIFLGIEEVVAHSNQLYISDNFGLNYEETIYVTFTTDSIGLAKIKAVYSYIPQNTNDYVKAKVRYKPDAKSEGDLGIKFPFERFYMEESKAPESEKAYVEASRDSTQITYALVSIKDGESVLKDVIIGGTSIKQIVKSRQQNIK